MAFREIPGPGSAALAVGGVAVVLGAALWWLMPAPRERKSTEYMRRARGIGGLDGPWQGTDHLERRATTIKNRLSYIITDGPNAKSGRYIDEAKAFIRDLEEQSAPRGRARRWKESQLQTLRGRVRMAERAAGRRGLSGLDMPPDGHLEEARQLVARAKREIENARNTRGCNHDRVFRATEALALAAVAASDAGSKNIERKGSWPNPRSAETTEEREANVLFGLAMSYREEAKEILERCAVRGRKRGAA